MYNKQFTIDNRSKTSKISKRYYPVFDNENKILVGINKKSICDLNNLKIALFSHFEKQKNSQNKNVKVRVYTSKYGEFRFYNGLLYLDSQNIGAIKKKQDKKGIGILLMSILLLLLTFAIIMMIEVPDRSNQFTIKFYDNQTEWEDGKKIGIFPSTIQPGSEGNYSFSIKNTENVEVEYYFSISEVYNQQIITNFPMKYRLKINNLYVGDSKEWLDGSKLKFDQLIISSRSKDIFTLEWKWPYAANDTTDTFFGIENGEYALILKMTAQYH